MKLTLTLTLLLPILSFGQITQKHLDERIQNLTKNKWNDTTVTSFVNELKSNSFDTLTIWTYLTYERAGKDKAWKTFESCLGMLEGSIIQKIEIDTFESGFGFYRNYSLKCIDGKKYDLSIGVNTTKEKPKVISFVFFPNQLR